MHKVYLSSGSLLDVFVLNVGLFFGLMGLGSARGRFKFFCSAPGITRVGGNCCVPEKASIVLVMFDLCSNKGEMQHLVRCMRDITHVINRAHPIQ